MSLFRSRLGLMVLIGAISMFVLAIGPAAAQANDTFNVPPGTTADESQGSGSCVEDPATVWTCSSLRAAVETANNFSGDDTINVPAGTYNLDYGRLKIDRCNSKGGPGTVTITGAGARETFVDGRSSVDGESNDRVFKIYCGKATITDLTVQHGQRDYGAGIYVRYEGELTLRNVAVVDNIAEDCREIDVTTNGPVPVVCCEPGKGAGIYNENILNVEQSLIANNTAKGGKNEGGYGGGIYNEWVMKLTNVTLNNNLAEDSANIPEAQPDTNVFSTYPGEGGGIYQEPYIDAQAPQAANGGLQDYTSHVLNVTVAGNTAGVGGGVASGTFLNADSNQQEFTPTIDFKNTIVANNAANFITTDGTQTNGTSGTNDCFFWEFVAASLGNNLESAESCGFIEPGDIQHGNPALGALTNNTGPTDTMALGDGSQALDTAANSACPPTDQRYVTRPQGPVCDIGAYEKEVTQPAPAAGTAAATAAKPVAKSSIKGPE